VLQLRRVGLKLVASSVLAVFAIVLVNYLIFLLITPGELDPVVLLVLVLLVALLLAVSMKLLGGARRC
jgi:hypothetical protein